MGAEVVALLRLYLDTVNKGLKLRLVDGSAQGFLWAVKGNPRVDLPGQNYTFVYEVLQGMIHSTLKDGNGYVEGCTHDFVERYIKAHPFVFELLGPAAKEPHYAVREVKAAFVFN